MSHQDPGSYSSKYAEPGSVTGRRNSVVFMDESSSNIHISELAIFSKWKFSSNLPYFWNHLMSCSDRDTAGCIRSQTSIVTENNPSNFHMTLRKVNDSKIYRIIAHQSYIFPGIWQQIDREALHMTGKTELTTVASVKLLPNQSCHDLRSQCSHVIRAPACSPYLKPLLFIVSVTKRYVK